MLRVSYFERIRLCRMYLKCYNVFKICVGRFPGYIQWLKISDRNYTYMPVNVRQCVCAHKTYYKFS